MSMKKILSIIAAMLVAFAVNAQTDFAAPGYSCAADDAVLTGGSSSNFYLKTDVTPHCVAWSDVSLSSNALATWTVNASRGCYVTVSLDLGPVIASNKHNFEVTIKDANGNSKGKVTEGGENTASEQVKVLEGTILIPAAGTYTVEVYNNRDWGKGTIKNVILTYAADAPAALIEVTGIELNKTTLPLEVDEVEQLLATVTPEDAFDPSVTWVSSDETVVTVVDGLVTALAAGTTTITATAGEISTTCVVTVAAAAVPSTDFAEPFALTAKKAHLEGAVWKMYTSDTYKIYGDGGSNKNYGNAIWTINVTRPCIVSGVVNGVEGGHIFGLDAYYGEELKGSLEQPDGKVWSAGEIALNGTLTFAEAGEYILKLRNTQEWSSGKAAGVTLTFVEDLTPVLPTVAIAGSMNSWNAETNVMTPAEDGLSASVTINLTDWYYEFKVVVDGSQWMSLGDNPEDLYTLHRNWNKVSGLATDKQNFKLTPDVVPGDYTFKWTYATGELEVIFPAEPVYPDVTYYFVNTPNWASVYAYAWDPEIAAWPGELMTLTEETIWDYAIYSYTMPENRKNIIFNDGNNGDGHQTANLAVEDGKPYYYKTQWYESLDAVATAISNTEAAMPVEKMIENGQLFIIKNGVKYNALGTVVK